MEFNLDFEPFCMSNFSNYKNPLNVWLYDMLSEMKHAFKFQKDSSIKKILIKFWTDSSMIITKGISTIFLSI